MTSNRRRLRKSSHQRPSMCLLLVPFRSLSSTALLRRCRSGHVNRRQSDNEQLVKLLRQSVADLFVAELSKTARRSRSPVSTRESRNALRERSTNTPSVVATKVSINASSAPKLLIRRARMTPRRKGARRMVRPRATVVWSAGVAVARIVLTGGMRTRCGRGHTAPSRSGLRERVGNFPWTLGWPSYTYHCIFIYVHCFVLVVHSVAPRLSADCCYSFLGYITVQCSGRI